MKKTLFLKKSVITLVGVGLFSASTLFAANQYIDLDTSWINYTRNIFVNGAIQSSSGVLGNGLTTENATFPQLFFVTNLKNPTLGGANIYYDQTGGSPTNQIKFGRYNSSLVWQKNVVSIDMDAPSNTFLLSESGDIGIGTSTPLVTLDINQGSYGLPATSGTTQATSGLRIRAETGGNVVMDNGVAGATGSWIQSTNRTDLSATYPLLLNPNGGNVGIGIINPTQRLHVSGNGIITGNLTVNGTITGNAATATTLQNTRTINGVSFNGSADITLPTVNTSGNQTVGGVKTFSSDIVGNENILLSTNSRGIYFKDTAGSTPGFIMQNDNNFVFYTTSSGGAYQQVWSSRARNNGFSSMSISATGGLHIVGNTGIGVENPSEKLEIAGNVRTTGQYISTNIDQARYIQGSYGVIHRNDGSNYYMLLTNSGSQYGTFNGLRPFSINTASGHVNLGNGALYTQHSGNVGIGNTNPGQKLDVSGNIRTSGQLMSTVANGTAPLTVTSTTRVSNLNVARAGTADALTTARTIGGVSFNGTANINLPGVNTAGNQSTTGNAATATTLQNARTINGVSFNGGANITLPTVNTSGDQTVGGLKAFSSSIQAQAGIFASGATLDVAATGNNIVRINTNGSERLRIDGSGNMGIGTTSPAQKLDVSGNIRTTNQFISTLATGTAPLTVTSTTRVSNLNVARAGTADALTTARSIAGVSFNGTADISIPFANIGSKPTTISGYGITDGVTTSGNQTIAGVKTFSSNIIANGNVGIGTSSPTARLSIGTNLTGTAASTTFNTNAGALGSNQGNQLLLANIGYTSTNQSSLGIRALRTSAGSDWTTSAVGIGLSVDNTIGVNGSGLWFASNGNVGIGTSTPGAALQINGASILGSSAINYNPAGSTWNYTLRLDGLDSTSIGFHDTGANVGSIRFQNNNFYIGSDDGWGTISTTFGGNVKATGFCIGSDCITSWPVNTGCGAQSINILMHGNTCSYNVSVGANPHAKVIRIPPNDLNFTTGEVILQCYNGSYSIIQSTCYTNGS